MVFVQMRLTPGLCGNPELATYSLVAPQLKTYFEKFGTIENFGSCLEEQNKFGEATEPHYHINVELDDSIRDFKKDTFQAWFRQRLFLPKGNKCYSIRLVGDPEDTQRWWRYLLKEVGAKIFEFPTLDIDTLALTLMAQDERKLQIDRNVAARDRMLLNDSFRIRCYSAVQTELLGTAVNNRSIYCAIIRYYMANNKVPPFNSLMNMVWDYRVHFELMTPEQYYDLVYTENPNNF